MRMPGIPEREGNSRFESMGRISVKATIKTARERGRLLGEAESERQVRVPMFRTQNRRMNAMKSAGT